MVVRKKKQLPPPVLPELESQSGTETSETPSETPKPVSQNETESLREQLASAQNALAILEYQKSLEDENVYRMILIETLERVASHLNSLNRNSEKHNQMVYEQNKLLAKDMGVSVED